MAIRNYMEFAKVLLNGSWGTECNDPEKASHDDMQTSALLLIAEELRKIRHLLECENLPRGLKAMQKLEALAREFWVRAPKKRKLRR